MNKKTEKKQEEAKGTKKTAQAKRVQVFDFKQKN